MAVIIGMKQRAKTYQLMQETNNNYYYINNELSSNLLYLNTEANAYNDATINFKNNFQFGYINNKISINNSIPLFTVDNTRIDLYKNTNIHSDLIVDNYLYTSNNTTFFNNNINISLNNTQNSFKINLNSNSELPIVDITKNNAYFRNNNLITSNIIIEKGGTLYTNFIDSPNLEPVVIKNMQFAESLRILTANIIQNISIDNDIIFANLTDYYAGIPNSLTNIPSNISLWNNYMTANNINKIDPYFSRPNINVIKYVDNDIYGDIGGSNILEFRTAKIDITSNIKKKVYSINNDGYMCIGEDTNKDIPLKINISPSYSNIIQYTNINNINKSFSLNSNGFINIGSINSNYNQLNINKNNNIDRTNTDLISLNINNINYTTNSGQTTINFIINDNISEFIFKFDSIINNITNNIDITIIITNPFIQNNIIPVNTNLYNNTLKYEIDTYAVNNDISQSLIFSENIQTIIKNPLNTFKIDNISTRIQDTFKFQIYNQISRPTITDDNHYKIIQFYRLSSGKKITYEFYIHKTSNYVYTYDGIYYPPKTNFISGFSNNINKFSISENGNIGIGNNYTDIYNIYASNALIHNINCKTINNPLTKNISYDYCSLNDINAINNASFISTDLIISSSNFTSNFTNNNTIINSNLNILNNGGSVNINTKTILGGGNQYETYNLTINTANYSGKGIVIKNDISSIDPSLLIYSSTSNSHPFLTLQNTFINYKIGIYSTINSSNNFQIYNITNNKSIFENNSSNNSVSILNNSFVIFEDTNSNVKIYMGRIGKDLIVDWYDSIDNTGMNTTIDDTINMYGNLNCCSTTNINLINAYTNNQNKIKIGLGTSNISNDGLYIDLSTTITSNLTVKKDILLEGTILSTSDSNLKSNINKIQNPLNKLLTINGYTYIRTDTSNYETGLLAQEVKEILPEVVKFENEHYNIAYGNMSGLFVECIKELNKKIEDLTEKLELFKI